MSNSNQKINNNTLESINMLLTPIVFHLLANYEKIAIKQLASGNIFCKIYSDKDQSTILETINEEFQKDTLVIESFIQSPPFIDDNIDGLEVMISIK